MLCQFENNDFDSKTDDNKGYKADDAYDADVDEDQMHRSAMSASMTETAGWQ